MKIRTLAASLAVAALATLPLAGAAAAQPDRDCPDFATQADAQAALESSPTDRERLDADGDGSACDSYFEGRGTPAAARESGDGDGQESGGGQVAVVPQGAVDTGDGSGGTGGAPAPLLVGGLAGGVVLAGGAVAARRAVRG